MLAQTLVQAFGGKMLGRRGDFRQFRLQPVPAADIPEPENHQRQEAEHDQKELQHFVVDGRGQSAEEDIDQHDHRRDHRR